MVKRILLGAKHSVIEPLGLLHLSQIAKQEGWQSKIELVEDHDFQQFDSIIKQYNPEVLGFTLYTGNHLQTFSYLDHLRKNFKGQVVLGGPHPTYFPEESLKHADFIVLSEGFNALRTILRGEAERGIVPLVKQEPFPLADRKDFYRDYPKHNSSPIKSIITSTGCPYSCTYCYNSSTLEDISGALTPLQKQEMARTLGNSQRLFPRSARSVNDIIEEVKSIKNISPQTKMIYFQDDVFGVSLDWLKEFTPKYASLTIPFHAQMRFEFADPKNPKCRERLELMREAGCTGLTFAIESSNPVIRREVLNRNMSEELMFESFEMLNSLGYKVRTEQMLGLPYGATTQETKINFEADLETLALNIQLKEKTGLPTMAWASIFAPYRGTKISDYCLKHGFYSGGNNDVPDTFFQRSVLKFPKKWVGPSLTLSTDAWLSPGEQEAYRDKLQMLRDLFSYFAFVPKGDDLARKFLDQKDQSFFGLSTVTRRHLYDAVLYDI